MKIRKAVLPVAGMGTRFLPATKVVPKELLPIVDKPVIQYLVEEAVLSGIEEVIFVISKGKELIKDHFSHHPELEIFLEEKGRQDLLEKVRPIHKTAQFTFVYQNKPLGDGHAILMAEEAVGNEPFLVLFGDDIVKSDIPAAKQLIDHFKGESVLAVERIPKEKSELYGIIKPGRQQGRLYEVLGMIEKPRPEEAPSDLGIIGKYVCPPEIFDALKKAGNGKGGEKRLIDGFIKLQEDQKIWAVEIEGERFDTGHPGGLAAAANAFL
ncbi:UTP--glucose-1-phosphate uridylyltransferase [Candidatus Peregrinibacteria bacterium]|nr:UTP--glucose-1-phosphate uridylyltransferase [Candidatus Peregrinibacteria bacterium]